jgi:LmbE family N-acetylglucosaminyl deacetylase
VTEPLILTGGDRILILAPHPDDETLATAGLLQRAQAVGSEVRVLFVTDGENNPWAQRATERRWRIGAADRERWGERRRGEALAALACLGVSTWQTGFLGYPDQGLQALLLAGDDDLTETLIGEVGRFAPTLVVAPSLEDLHPDHSALAVFLRRAFARLPAGPRRPRERLFIVHHDGPLAPSGRDHRLVLSPEERERKRRAILCHASQLRMRRDALLSFAAAEEMFFAPGPVAEHSARHPIRHTSIEGGVLVLELARRSRPGAFGAADLWFALERPGERRSLVGRLPRRSGPVEVFERPGGSLIARGELEPRDRSFPERVVLPAALLTGWAQAFVKLERRFGFFDEAGWRPLPCPAAVASAPGRLAAPLAGSVPQAAAFARPARRAPR